MPTAAGCESHDRAAVRERARTEAYDVAIVGGGIAGAGIARDAAMRGLSTLLVEQIDFCAGTTAGSTRLIHGGLRYLEQYDFGLVFESLQERERLRRLAPHLVEPLTFILPQYEESLRFRLKLRLGMLLYDLLSYNKSMPWHDRLSAEGVLEREPSLPPEGLQGGYVYHDCQVPFVERLCLETVLDAAAHGADVLNHAEVTDVRIDGGRIAGLSVRDHLAESTLTVDSSTVVNATGPGADALLDGLIEERLVRPTKGIHLVVPALTSHALTLPTTDDRVIFVVPWGNRSLIGTTDTDFSGDPTAAKAEPADVAYLLKEAGRYFPDLGPTDILYSYAGVRPLYDAGGDQAASDVSRRHQVLDHGETAAGLFSLIGTKITTYRSAAEDLTDAVADHLDVTAPCRTASVPLPGANSDRSRGDAKAEEDHGYLESVYGTRASIVREHIESDPQLGEPLCPHTDDVLAQVTVAVQREYARTLPDVLLRRCTVGYERCEGLDAVDPVAEHMADLLAWGPERVRQEKARYESLIDRRHVDPAEASTTRLHGTPE